MSFFLYAVQVFLSEALRAGGLESTAAASMSNLPGYTQSDNMDTSDEHSSQFDRFKSISISDESALQSSSIQSNNPLDQSGNQYIPYNDLLNAIQPLCNDNVYATAIPDTIILDTGELIYLIPEDFSRACQTCLTVCYQNTTLIYMAFKAIETKRLGNYESYNIAILNRIPTDFAKKKSAMKRIIEEYNQTYTKFADLIEKLSPQARIKSSDYLTLARKKQLLLEKKLMEFVDYPRNNLDVIRKIYQETNHFYQMISQQYQIYGIKLLSDTQKTDHSEMLFQVGKRIEMLSILWELQKAAKTPKS